MTILFSGSFSVADNGFLPYGTTPYGNRNGGTTTQELCSNGTILNGGSITNSGIANRIQLVPDPLGSGVQVASIRTDLSDALTYGSIRSEVSLETEPLPYPTERWYAFSVLLPADWQPDANSEVLWQVHNYPDASLAGDASASIPPSMDCNIGTDMKITVRNAYDPNALSSAGTRTSRDLCVLDSTPGKWMDFVLHNIWSSDAVSGTGKIELYVNRRLVFVDYNKINTYNDSYANGGRGAYIRMGVYRWAHDSTPPLTIPSRTAYYKGFVVGDAASSFAEVTGTTLLETVSLKNGSIL